MLRWFDFSHQRNNSSIKPCIRSLFWGADWRSRCRLSLRLLFLSEVCACRLALCYRRSTTQLQASPWVDRRRLLKPALACRSLSRVRGARWSSWTMQLARMTVLEGPVPSSRSTTIQFLTKWTAPRSTWGIGTGPIRCEHFRWSCRYRMPGSASWSRPWTCQRAMLWTPWRSSERPKDHPSLVPFTSTSHHPDHPSRRHLGSSDSDLVPTDLYHLRSDHWQRSCSDRCRRWVVCSSLPPEWWSATRIQHRARTLAATSGCTSRLSLRSLCA